VGRKKEGAGGGKELRFHPHLFVASVRWVDDEGLYIEISLWFENYSARLKVHDSIIIQI
jgi:hypothetical protein